MGKDEVLIDISTFISNKRRKGKVSVVTLIEIMEWALRKYNEHSKKGDKLRALGYLNLITSLPLTVDEVIEIRGDEIRDLVYYVIEKNLDPTDAYFVVLGKRFKMPIITTDKDFERIKDEIEVIYP
ncbi:PIN domain-containing protein [Saccharolobus islandicus]|uniref:PIN domain-containing protein n=1 Tax=Saccharolobus islandicus TaxID=43080 RepID=UPI00069BA1F1|nr:PIN domain-containing protein [Sulfolobus islandicus]